MGVDLDRPSNPPQLSATLRRLLSLAAAFALVASSLSTLAPAAQAADICSAFPSGIGNPCVDLNNIENNVEQCTVQRAGLCGAIVGLAVDEVDQAIAVADQCINNSNTLCSQATTDIDQEIRDSENCASLQTQYLCGAVLNEALGIVGPVANQELGATENCASLQPQYLCGLLLSDVLVEVSAVIGTAEQCASLSPQYLCGQAVQLAESVVALVVAVAQACEAGDNTTCQTVFGEVNSLAAAAGNCVNMTPNTLCPAAVQVVEAEAFAVAAMAESCADGNDATCRTVVQVVDTVAAVAEQCVAGDPGTPCPSLTGLAQAEITAIQTLVATGPAPTITALEGYENPPVSIVSDPSAGILVVFGTPAALASGNVTSEDDSSLSAGVADFFGTQTQSGSSNHIISYMNRADLPEVTPIREGYYDASADRGWGWTKVVQKHHMHRMDVLQDSFDYGYRDPKLQSSNRTVTQEQWDAENQNGVYDTRIFRVVSDDSDRRADGLHVGLITGYCEGDNICPQWMNDLPVG